MGIDIYTNHTKRKPEFRSHRSQHCHTLAVVGFCALLPLFAAAQIEAPALSPALPAAPTEDASEQPREQSGEQSREQNEEQVTPPPAAGENPAHATESTAKDGVKAIDFVATARALREQAARYRQLADRWQPIAEGTPLRPGDQGPRVAQLRRILSQYGDYRGALGPVIVETDISDRYDAGLQRAVESYQRRHGMEVTGHVDTATLHALARSPVELADTLEINAERWEKLPTNPGERYILVNVPDYQLQLIEGQQVVLSMKTVVGKSSKRTPDLTTKVVSVVFNPTWTVPRSILLTDLLPKARNFPEAMHKRGYRVVKYGTNTTTPINEESLESAARGKATLRQIAGPGNTLGRVKFVIPNKQAIFLHDTQAQSLFELRHRAFSHGCIRLQQPEELAYALLGKQGWDRTRVAQATTGDESVTIKVDKPPRLFIAYLTAWVDTLGQVQFRPDIYHRDR
ncbi:L,D-transpeptidase family protein [Microbulbifer elongatus]|uniref:L,D-transpeptidase family protein n=1 Tax=Microbulbifer elongatus TaxID=86173 RepID=A0ABT1NY33_9GAMM|nr:L,D-transpeptidase family protein [Microbulbifer elongatus]MCQ3828795.1 L,D-transpeptidase family protein [Microbulbifer elongatus]